MSIFQLLFHYRSITIRYNPRQSVKKIVRKKSFLNFPMSWSESKRENKFLFSISNDHFHSFLRMKK